jgi:hypothetical protein
MNPVPALDPALLAQLQQFVADVLAATSAREQALATHTTSSADRVFRHALDECGQRVEQLATRGDPATAKLRQADDALAHGEQELRRFLTSAADFRQRLATWAARAID